MASDQGAWTEAPNGETVYEIPKPRKHHHLICRVCGGEREIGHEGRFGLPQRVDRIVLHDVPGGPHGRLEALVTTADDGGYGGQVVDEAGAVLLELSGYHTVELPGGLDPDRSAVLAQVMA